MKDALRVSALWIEEELNRECIQKVKEEKLCLNTEKNFWKNRN